jgi:hypothetical protein
MKFSHFLLALLAMVSVFAFVTWKRLSVDLEAELNTHANLINQAVPKVLNPHTDLIGARSDGREIIYLFRVHGFSAETMARSEAELRANKLDVAEADANIGRLLDSGARMTYEYFIGDELALRFTIERESTSS